jgi:uncharacterized protein (DUF983 family)
MNWVKENPSWFCGTITALVAAIINGLILWGITITLEQAAWINGLVLIVLPLVLSLWAQQPIQAKIDAAKAAGVKEGLKAKHD